MKQFIFLERPDICLLQQMNRKLITDKTNSVLKLQIKFLHKRADDRRSCTVTSMERFEQHLCFTVVKNLLLPISEKPKQTTHNINLHHTQPTSGPETQIPSHLQL